MHRLSGNKTLVQSVLYLHRKNSAEVHLFSTLFFAQCLALGGTPVSETVFRMSYRVRLIMYLCQLYAYVSVKNYLPCY